MGEAARELGLAAKRAADAHGAEAMKEMGSGAYAYAATLDKDRAVVVAVVVVCCGGGGDGPGRAAYHMITARPCNYV